MRIIETKVYNFDELSDEAKEKAIGNLVDRLRIILQKEYEYQTSEEAIIETIKANDCEFTEDGKLH